jgi:hypothetical protein
VDAVDVVCAPCFGGGVCAVAGDANVKVNSIGIE